MYTYQDIRDVESVCYEQKHTNKVLEQINKTFPGYFEEYLANEGSVEIAEKDIKRIVSIFGSEVEIGKKKNNDKTQSFKNIIIRRLNDFEKDRQKYRDILDEEVLEEYKDDPRSFKSKTLRRECPIINKTLNTHAKALEKYKQDFGMSDPVELLEVVTNLFEFAVDYAENVYDPDNYDSITEYDDLCISDIDTDDYTVYGVIGGGIKSHLLYKYDPSVFPSRSRLAIWALWYLTDQKVIDCEMDSEFLMLNLTENTTQQNYFYPYTLFTFYAHRIFQMLNAEAESLGVWLDPDYRYVIVDSFLEYVAMSHISGITEMTYQIKESNYGGE